MEKDKYRRILEQFELYYPDIYEQSVDWWVSGRMTIAVRLRDGGIFEYNRMDNSLRRIQVKEYSEDEEVRRKAFGYNLQKLIPFSGTTQAEIAKKLGITNAMMSRYVHGSSMPSADKANMIANLIGCRLDELFDENYIE